MSRAYRNSGKYRDGTFNYRGGPATIARQPVPVFNVRNPIDLKPAAVGSPIFKLEEVVLPGGRIVSRISTL